jgi:hypothetical protein
VNASLIRKYHIISLPYSTLKGLLPPLQSLVVVAVVEVDMSVLKISVQKYWLALKNSE